MCDCASGSPMDYKELFPPELQTMRRQTAAAITPRIMRKDPATIFRGQRSAQPDPNVLLANNLIRSMGGGGPYKYPGAGPDDDNGEPLVGGGSEGEQQMRMLQAMMNMFDPQRRG